MSIYYPTDLSQEIKTLEELDFSPFEDLNLDDLDPEGNFTSEIKSKSKSVENGLSDAKSAVSNVISGLYYKIEEDFENKFNLYVSNIENEEEEFPFSSWFEMVSVLKHDVKFNFLSMKNLNLDNEITQFNLAALSSEISKSYNKYTMGHISYLDEILKNTELLTNLLSYKDYSDKYCLLSGKELKKEPELKDNGCAFSLYYLLLKNQKKIVNDSLLESDYFLIDKHFSYLHNNESMKKSFFSIFNSTHKNIGNNLYNSGKPNIEFLKNVSKFIKEESFFNNFLDSYKVGSRRIIGYSSLEAFKEQFDNVIVTWKFDKLNL